jgi:predicted permease
LTESVLLALAGGAAGLLVTEWANRILVALLSSGLVSVNVPIHVNYRVLAFTLVVTVSSGVLFGLAPAFRATQLNLLPALKSGQGASPRRITAGKLLVGGQVALCLLLLVGAGLMLRTLRTLKGLDIGFERQDLMLFTLRPGLNGYDGTRLAGFYQEMQRRILALPGVRSVTFSDRAPIGEGSGSTGGAIPGYTEPGKGISIWRHFVGPGYFSTLGIEIAQGRPIGEQDGADAPKAVVVNQEFVRRYFHGDDPLGRQINLGNAKRVYEVVGVARDVKYGQLRREVPPTAYFSYLQRGSVNQSMTFEVRSAGSEVASLVAAVRRQALELDKDVPLVGFRTETQVIDQVLFLERTFAALSSAFASLALLLACVGLYGTMAYSIARRTHEIGIRMVLGAERARILAMILRETLLIVAGGLIVGAPAAWAGGKLLKNQLYGLGPHDPATLLLATFALLAVSLMAGYLPAQRAAKMDPMLALRYE